MPLIENTGASMNKSKKNLPSKRDDAKNLSYSHSNQREPNQDLAHGSVGDSVIIKEGE